MSATIAAVITQFQGDVTLAAINGPYRDFAPERKAYPYAVVTQIPNAHTPAFGTRYIENVHVRIMVFHTSASTLKTYHDAVHDRFDRESFTVSGGSQMSCVEQFEHTRATPFFSDDNERVYNSIHDFIVQVDRAR
jgi:hypothetical protein